MASSEFSITALLRPRYISVAVIAAAAVTTIGFGVWHDHHRRVEQQEEEIRRSAGTLHRSNAVRRNGRASQTQQQTSSSDNPQPTPSAETATNLGADENAPEPAETIIDDPEADERWLDDDTSQAAIHRAGQNIVSLLFRVSEDNARRSSYVHRGCACNACGIVPIRGIRYRCANCADFDLCETCESQGLHIKTHIFYKVKVPAPPFGPRQMQPVWYPGDPDTRVRNLSKSLINRLARQTGFERQELEAFWEQWTYMANTEWRDDPDELYLAMDRKTFERCLVPSGGYRHTAPNLIHDRMFAFYDTNNDDLIGFSEFLEGLSYRKRKDKLRKIFDGYDTDGDGFVSRRDFLRFFRAYYVLYKQMQKDILEGLDDQVMSSIETQQLVNGRQPLSSMFGREGRVPAADLQRAMAGKVINNQTGETIVEDSPNGMVAEDGTDTANREDLMARLFTRWSRQLMPSGMYQDRYVPVEQDDMADTLNDSLAASNYWDALLNPPTRVQDLPNLLIGQVDPSMLPDMDDDDLFVPNADTYGADGEGVHWDNMDSASERPHAFQDASQSVSGTTSPEDAPGADGSGAGEANGHATSQSRSNTAIAASNGGTGFAVLDGDLQDRYRSVAPNTHPRFNTLHPPTPGQIRAQFEASTQKRKLRSSKIVARRKLHHRWVRRNFYLDEEEGATAPSQWQPEKDILAGVHVSGAAGEPSSSAAAAASRVRFNTNTEANANTNTDADGATADDYERYEAQPSPSSSARTVLPDTWGSDYGKYRYPDMPEAERDAGREILYQVMQQSFNEMLDTLFMNKEDLAIAAAETKDQRDQYRHLFKEIDLVKEWGDKLFSNGKLEKPTQPHDSHDSHDKPAHASRSTGADTTTNPNTLNRPLDQMDLDELLNLSGYDIDESALEDSGVSAAGGAVSTADRLLREGAPEPESQGDREAQPETAAARETDEGADEGANGKADVMAEQVEATESRDPTLPQFRPNTEAEYQALVQAQATGTASATSTSTSKRTTATLSATVEDANSADGAELKGKNKESNEAMEAKKAETTADKDKDKDKDKDTFSTAFAPDISREDLARLKGLDLAEREAHERGGWGKLNYTEFEAIFRREEVKNNRLDYLGSWIDFCIP